MAVTQGEARGGPLQDEVVGLEDGTFQAICPVCHTWRSEPKDDQLSAVRALSGHLKTCSRKGSPGSLDQSIVSETQTEEGKKEDLIFVSHEQQLFNQVKAELKKLLPQVSGIGDNPKSKTVESILLTLTLENTARPEILISHIQSCAKSASPYVTALVVNSIYSRLGQAGLYAGGLAPIGLYAGASYGAQGQPRYSNEYRDGYAYEEDLREREEIRDREKDREQVKELKEELHDVREKLEQEKEERHKLELQQLQSQIQHLQNQVSALAAQPPGKSLIDVIDKGIDRVDGRASDIVDRLGKPKGSGEFNPEVKRTPQQRKEIAEDIQAKLEKKERILQAENELLIAAAMD